MKNKFVIAPVALSLLAVTMVTTPARAETSVSVNINGYLPPPPGVHVYYEAGRPYYREGGRVVYLEKRHPKGKRGHAYGHRKHGYEHEYEHERHGHGHHGR